MRSRWWAGWCENAIQQSEEMPGMRACDEEERTDRQGHATVEMPGLPAELDDAAARPQTGADAGGVPLMAAGAVVPDGVGIHGRRARPAQADRMVLVNPAAHRPAGREAPHGHGRRHVHGPRLAPDHRHRRRKRRSPRLPVARIRGAAPLLPAVGETVPRGGLFAFPGPALAAGGPVARTTNRLEGGVNSVVKNVLRNPRTARGAHAPRVRMGVLHEDRAPAAGIIHSRRSAGGRESDVARTGRRRLARIRDRHRLERIPHRHAISQRHRLTPRTRPKAPQKFL